MFISLRYANFFRNLLRKLDDIFSSDTVSQYHHDLNITWRSAEALFFIFFLCDAYRPEVDATKNSMKRKNFSFLGMSCYRLFNVTFEPRRLLSNWNTGVFS